MTLVLLLSFLLPLAAGAQEPLTLTLDAAVELGLKQNLDVALAEERLNILQSYYRQAIAAAIPDISVTGAYTRNFEKPSFFLMGTKLQAGSLNSMRAAAALEQVVYSGGIVSSGIRATKTGIAAGEQDLRGAKAEVTLAVKRLFYAVFLASETAGIQADTLASAEDHLKTIEERYRQGLDSDLIVLRQRVEVSNNRPLLITARNQHELTSILLKDTLGLDVDASIRLVGSLAPPGGPLPPYDELQKRALDRSPDYQASIQHIKQTEAMIRVAKGLNSPQLSIYADYQWYAESNDLGPNSKERATSSAGGLRLRYPLFTGGDLQERVLQARIAHQQALTLSDKTQRAIRVEVKRAWLSAQEAAERVQSQESAVAQARRALESTENRYKEGQSSQLELTDATLALLKTRLLYAQALHDYRVQLAALERAVGSPIEEASR
ncbi:MAG: TolC family protein [Elusimicrobia bacterium]|nr:TolC family protein [Elusimicrobiota bacterium]